MRRERTTNDIALRLRQLWKGAIYVGISGIYAFILGMILVYKGWRPALLTLFLLTLVQLFRYIAGDVDRLGWVMDKKEIEGSQEETRRYQGRMLLLLFSLIQVFNFAIIYQIYVISTEKWALLLLLGIVMVEIMFRHIRKINHEINYKMASYGIKDASPMTHGPVMPQSDRDLSKEKIEKKLATLRKMVDKNEISLNAYESVRDQELISLVMND